MKKMGVRAIARKAKVSPAMVSMIIRRRRNPSKRMAERLERATGVPCYAWMWPDLHDNPYVDNCRQG
ncbi:MAG: helix-turn-helix transcriptional regulator [Deltaproteobacteria bacterium]|nr:helix-turn-helix transcriptional regulator [Deltaproteobacteria bacterium]